MNLTQLNKKYNTQIRCIRYLEKLRWPKGVGCVKCGSMNVVDLKKQHGRFHCNDCKTTFSVLTDTIFEQTRLPLPKWFQIITLMLNAKTGISAKELQRDIGVTYKTAWYTAMRVRCGMIDFCNIELEGVIEMDESYLGGKPRHRKPKSNQPNLSRVTPKRGRGTSKTPVVGIVERKGRIVLKVVEKLTARNLLAMLNQYVKIKDSIVVTDEFKSYKGFDDIVQHYTVNHSKKEYVRGMMHTNTIEGFWAIVKNSIKGNYIAVSKKYLPFYLVQSQYVFNSRNLKGNLFERFLKEALQHDQVMEHYKPLRPVKQIVHPKCKK